MMKATTSTNMGHFTQTGGQIRDFVWPSSPQLPPRPLSSLSCPLSEQNTAGHPPMKPQHISERHKTDGLVGQRPRSSRSNSSSSSRYHQFWDSLPKVLPSRLSLQELDWRNETRQGTKTRAPVLVRKSHVDIASFARHGGPDLSHLRAV